MFLLLHALACLNACAGRVAQLVRALLSHSRGPRFESVRDHSPKASSAILRAMPEGLFGGLPPDIPSMTPYRHLRTLFASVAFFVAAQDAPAQQPPPRPTPEQTRAMLQARPELIQQLRQKLVSTGMSREQIHARLRAEGYPEDMLDAYLPGGTGTAERLSRSSRNVPGEVPRRRRGAGSGR